MATLREIVYNIKNVAEGGSSLVEDSKISDRQVEFLVNAYRAKALIQYTNSGRSVHPQTIQNFKHTSTTDDNSFIEFPSVVNFNKNRAVKSVVFYDSSTATSEYVQIGTKGSTAYLSGNRFTSAQKNVRIQDGRMYFQNFKLDTGDYIQVAAVFSNPTEITTNEGLFNKDTSMYPRDTEIDGEAPTEIQRQIPKR